MRNAAVALSAALLLASCGGGDGEKTSSQSETSVQLKRQLSEAQRVSAADFPAPRGRTLQQIANTVRAQAQIGLATSVYTPGQNRLAFGVLDSKPSLVYGKTAVYVARGPNHEAKGPFPAPADSLIVDPPFRSKETAHEGSEIAAIYSTKVPLPRPGKYAVLAVTRVGSRLVGAAAGIAVTRKSPIPKPGYRAPDVATDTLASAGGDIEKIDTRVPPDDMHRVSFHDVLNKKPVAILFATPRLCESRVCGPVVDIAAQLEKSFGDRVQFIHEEVFIQNDVAKGYRPPLRAFGLRTEPWLFTVDRRGRVAARLEGSFGINEFRRAIELALG